MASRPKRKRIPPLKQRFRGNHPLGGGVAEREDRIGEYYVAIDRYVQPMRESLPGIVIHVGPKGAGKSAIQKVALLERATFSDRLIELRPDEIKLWTAANSTNLLKADGVDPRWLNRTLWTYLFCVEVFRAEFNDFSGLWDRLVRARVDKDVGSARRLIERSYSRDDSRSLTERLLDLIEEVKVAGSLPDGTSAEASAKLRKSDPRESTILTELQAVSRNLSKLLKHRYVILLDDLDQDWTNTPPHRLLLDAMIAAIQKLSRSGCVSFVVALRDDIFNSLQIDDRDKLREDVVYVTWDERQLKEMITARCKWADASESSSATFDSTFDPACGMRRVWDVAGANPRRAIQICEAAIVKARDAGLSLVTPEILNEAVLHCSQEFLRDLGVLHQYVYPELVQIALLLRSVRLEFDYADLEDVAVRVAETVAPDLEWARSLSDDPISLASQLMELRLLQFKESRAALPCPYIRETHTVSKDTWYSVHPSYRPALGIQKPTI